jgi:Transposase
VAVVVGGLGHQPPGVAGAGLEDRARRRVPPEECSLGTMPRKPVRRAGRSKRSKPPTSAATPEADSVSIPRKQRSLANGRSRRRVERYLSSLPERHRNSIEVVSIDPYEAYRQAIRAVLPGARIVVDHFHLVRGANTALDAVRRKRQREHARRRPKGVRRSGHGEPGAATSTAPATACSRPANGSPSASAAASASCSSANP